MTGNLRFRAYSGGAGVFSRNPPAPCPCGAESGSNSLLKESHAPAFATAAIV